MPPLFLMFMTVFLAELGDKTQLATVLFASKGEHNPWLVFAVAASALVVSTGIAVLLGTMASRYLEMIPLKLVAGVGFILLGSWTLLDHFKG
jgi:putative Ca2+/H+ antiporter (TMEM165/GDT1 family)